MPRPTFRGSVFPSFRQSIVLLAALGGSVTTTVAGAQENAQPGYDARLTAYAYPYPVRFFELQTQQQTLEMAYMDVEPAAPNGHTVLLLHGKNFSGAYWARTIQALEAEGYRVIAPDQIGFGKSSKPDRFQYTFHALASHTRALLESRGVKQVTVVGHSMGGMLATRFALMFPDLARQLVLVNPLGLEDWKRLVPYQTIEDRYRRALTSTPELIRRYMQSSYFGGEWKPAYDALVAIQAGWTQGPDHDKLAWISALASDMIFTQPVVHEFPDITQPTLLIVGTRDRTALGKDQVPAEVAETMGRYDRLGAQAARAIPNATLVELDDVGHVPHWEAFDRYIRALRSFLDTADIEASR